MPELSCPPTNRLLFPNRLFRSQYNRNARISAWQAVPSPIDVYLAAAAAKGGRETKFFLGPAYFRNEIKWALQLLHLE